jgi:hypothetical protein
MLRSTVWPLLLLLAACGKADNKPVDVQGVVLGGDGLPQEGAFDCRAPCSQNCR